MYLLPPISRHGNSIQFGFSPDGLHLRAVCENLYRSEVVLREAELPLDWKRIEIAESATTALKRYDFSSGFFIVGMTGYMTDDEQLLYCLTGGFRARNDDTEWYDLHLDITTYVGNPIFVGTRAYHLLLRATEVQKIADLVCNYWN